MKKIIIKVLSWIGIMLLVMMSFGIFNDFSKFADYHRNINNPFAEMETFCYWYFVISITLAGYILSSIHDIKKGIRKQLQTQNAMFKLISLLAENAGCDNESIENIKTNLTNDLK